MSHTKKITAKAAWPNGRTTILYVEKIPSGTIGSIQRYAEKIGRPLKVALVYDVRFPEHAESGDGPRADLRIACDFSSDKTIRDAILPIEQELLAITCRWEGMMGKFKALIPHVPYLRTPTETSITWSTDKLEMRRALRQYDKSISPKYTLVTGYGHKDLEKIKKNIGFPLVVKPTGLAQSLLVSICFHQEELEKSLKRTFKAVAKVYKERGSDEKPRILVEQFIEGTMYSIDAYINSRGSISFCPFFHVKTGRDIGFDDFFGYRQMCPTTLSKESIKEGQLVAIKAIRALGLRNTSAHIELIRSDAGWKVVELGARLGGFRHDIYNLTFGIDHALNDVLTRLPDKPIIPGRCKGFAAVMKFFPKKEGVLVSLKGIKKAQLLASFHSITINKKIGDKCEYAKNGGLSVFNIILFNKNRSDFLADVRRLEQVIEIMTE